MFFLLLVFFNESFILFHRLLGNTDNRGETTLLKMETSSFSNLMHQMQQRKSEQSVYITVLLHFLGWYTLPLSFLFFSFLFLFVFRTGSHLPNVPKHRFSKLWQLCYLRSGSAPTPNCRSIWRSILLSRYFINLHHGCQHWHSWQRGQCHLLFSPFCR